MAPLALLVHTSASTFERLDGWVREGIPAAQLRTWIDQGELAAATVYGVVIPPRTLSHRVARRENLSTSEADALVRLLRLRDLAQETFGDPVKSARWLARPSSLLAGAVPADLLNTELGGRRVEEALVRIAHGQLA